MSAVAAAPARGALLSAFVELGKPRLSAVAVLAVLAGLRLGASGPLPAALTVATTAGTMLAAMGGSALNMFRERHLDALMHRTQGRPLPSGRLTPAQVLAFGAVCCAVGIGALAWFAGPLATTLCTAIVLTYVMIYTPLKRITPLNTLVGAVPGALPPVVGYAAGAGQLDERALALFLVLFFWQIPHFLAIAWRYREDYERGGMRMLPVVDPEGRSTARQMVFYTLGLLAASIYVHVVGLAGPLYFVACLFLGVVFLAAVALGAITRRAAAMRMTFLVSLLYLTALLAVMVLDRIEP